jgi:tRNA modification GTPase
MWEIDLMNALLNEERAIVSEVAELPETLLKMSHGGIGFRFIDTAGIRETKDVVESIGIKRLSKK